MRVLTIGPGAEDARSPFRGHVGASLVRCGHEVWEYDAVVAARTDRTGDHLPVLAWLFDEMRPDHVVAWRPPTDVSAVLADRGVPVRVVTDEEMQSHCHVAAFAPAPDTATDAAPDARPNEPEFDVVVAGEATLPAIRTMIALWGRGLRVMAWGDGWDGVRVLTGCVAGALPYSSVGDALRRGSRVLAVGPEAPRQALEAAAAGRPVLTGATVADVLAACELPAPAVADVDPDADWTGIWFREFGGCPTVTGKRISARDRTPRVSFFMPTYNNVAYLASSVESVLDQTVDDLEVILQDDGSTDGTASVLQRYESNPRVRIVRQLNIGQRDRFDVLHRRTAHLARGEFLAALGSDDLCAPDRLAAQLAVFDADPELDFCFSAARRIDNNGRDRGRMFELLVNFTQATLFRDLAVGNLLAHPTVLYKRDVYDRIGPMEEGFSSDYHLWIKSAGRMKFRYLARNLISYRVHENSSSMSTLGAQRAAVRGTEAHDVEILRRGLHDLYPELAECRGTTARAAAEVDLGNRMLWLFPNDAGAAYERAAALLGSTPPTLLHNLAVAALLAGDLPSAQRLTKRAGLPNGEVVSVSIASGRRSRDLLTSVHRADVFSPTFADAMRRTEQESIAWDGLPGGIRRILVLPSSARPDLLAALLQVWCSRTSPGDPMCLLIPTLGDSPDAIAGRVLEAAAEAGVDLDAAADISIEGIDGLDLLPPNYVSGAFVLETESDLLDAAGTIRQGLPSLPAQRMPYEGVLLRS